MKYEITKEQLQELAKGNAKVEKWFPEAFETKLEVGVWYKMKRNSPVIFCVTTIFNNVVFGYGINYKGEWFNNANDDNQIGCSINSNLYTPAMNIEIQTALVTEAKNKGFVEGAKFKSSISEKNIKRTVVSNSLRWGYNYLDNYLTISAITSECENFEKQSNPIIFQDGVWAEIIKEKTLSKSEAEAKLNELINDGYDYKIV